MSQAVVRLFRLTKEIKIGVCTIAQEDLISSLIPTSKLKLCDESFLCLLQATCSVLQECRSWHASVQDC